MASRSSFRALLAAGEPVVTPSAHDALSARLIELAGFPAIAIGGLPMLASQQAIPDIGLATLPDMVEGARVIMRGARLPCGIDVDDGFGDARHVVRTIRALADLGIGAVILEDQLRAAKKPGEARTSALETIGGMQAKLRAAVAARATADIVIQARTDAYAAEGLDAAIRRAEAYLDAGAESIFVSGLEEVDELERLGARLGGRTALVAVVTERNVSRWPGPRELGRMGFRQICYPGMLIARAAATMREGLGLLAALNRGEVEPATVPSFAASSRALQYELGLDEWAAHLTRHDVGAAS